MLIRNYRKNIGLMAGVEFLLFRDYQLLDSLSQSKRNVSLADWTSGKYFFILPVFSVKFHLECWLIVIPIRPTFI